MRGRAIVRSWGLVLLLLPSCESDAVAPAAARPRKEAAVSLTIVYDNESAAPGLRSGWGFACVVEREDTRVLFDTGADGRSLVHNLRALGIEARSIGHVALSHFHADHTGGLDAFLRANPGAAVWVPPSFPERFRDAVRRQGASVSSVQPRQEIADGIYSTGEVAGAIPEQALVVRSGDAVLLLTGCAHPGIDALARRAREQFGRPIELALGGFHLAGKGEPALRRLAEELEGLEVRTVAPCHCSGSRAQRVLREVYGDRYRSVGTGSVLSFGLH